MRLKQRIAVAVLAPALLLAAVPPALAELAGQYVIHGTNPSGQQYEGRAAIKSADGVYQVVWKIAERKHVGTGILKGELFSVVYQATGRGQRPGVVVYEVQADGSLVGVWVGLGRTETGTERWRPAARR
jgi:hypothetical protein